MGTFDAMSGKTNFQATPYGANPNTPAALVAEQNKDAYVNPYAATDKNALAQAMDARNAIATPTMSAASTQAASAAAPDMGQANQIRGMQLGGLNQLQQAASGTAPSAAQIQGQQQLAQALEAQRGQAASMRGVSPALAQHLAAQSGAQMQGQALVGAAQLRANEQANARNAYAQALDAARGQDLSATGLQQNNAQFNAGNQQQTNLFNAGNQQQSALANQQAALQAQQQRDAMNQFYLGGQLGIDQSQYQGNMAYAQSQQQGYENAQAINAGIAQSNAQGAGGLWKTIIGGGTSAIGSGLAMSDERAKESIDRESTGKDIDGFIKALDTASWNYRKGIGEDPNKRHWGVMAQSLAKTDVGRSMLLEGDDGLLRIDTTKGFGALLAAQRRLNDRLEELERVKKRRSA